MCVRCVHRMGNACKHTPAARIAAREAEIDGIAFMRFLVAFLRCFLNVENAGILSLEIGEGTVLPGIQAAGVRRDLRIALGQIHKIKARVRPTAALCRYMVELLDDNGYLDSEDMAAISAGEDVATTSTDYFAAVRLSRQQARDNAVNLLQEAMSYSESSKEAESAVELEQIVQTALSEAQIESLIIAKGYADCVAYMSGEGISIAVASPEGGLQREDVAVIADIVMAQSDYSLNDIRVVEVQ